MQDSPEYTRRVRFVLSLLVGAALGAGCRNIQREKVSARAAERQPPLVVVERDAHATRLVLADETGARVRVITGQVGEQGSADLMPALSPDGRFVVFASTRDRPQAADSLSTSLWLVPSDGSAPPARLTDSGGIDWMPAWSPDGRTIVFASTREQGAASTAPQFDLWTISVVRAGSKLGVKPPQRLTATPDLQELDPAWAPDGKHLVCSGYDGGSASLDLVTFPGGSERALTGGPADKQPTWRPDGRVILFSGQAHGREDLDLYALDIDPDGRHPRHRRVLIDDQNGDEGNPRFSADGHWVAGTTIFRDQAGNAILNLVIVAELTDQPVWRVLLDAHPAARFGVAVSGAALDGAALRRLEPHDQAIGRLLGLRHP
jgi:dipeptidyl aminopeptidase/acylaminoacyl peptidase